MWHEWTGLYSMYGRFEMPNLKQIKERNNEKQYTLLYVSFF